MVRAAAKNHASVAVITDPSRYDDVVQAVKDGGFTGRQRRELAADVDALAERVAPRARARAAGEELSVRAHETVDSLRARAGSLRERARDHIERAQDGDAESIRVVAAVAGGVVAGAALLGVLIGRSRG